MYASAVPYPHPEAGISSGNRVRAKRSRRSTRTASGTAMRNGSLRMRGCVRQVAVSHNRGASGKHILPGGQKSLLVAEVDPHGECRGAWLPNRAEEIRVRGDGERGPNVWIGSL